MRPFSLIHTTSFTGKTASFQGYGVLYCYIIVKKIPDANILRMSSCNQKWKYKMGDYSAKSI